MNPLLLELLPLVRQGYCCSQLLMLLALRQRGEENAALVQAMRGLCHGIGQSGGPCGLLTGGACVLALLGGQKKTDGQYSQEGQDGPPLPPLLNDYAEWFYARMAGYGGYDCSLVSTGLAREAGQALEAGAPPDVLLCGNLLAECWDKILTLCDDYGLDTL